MIKSLTLFPLLLLSFSAFAQAPAWWIDQENKIENSQLKSNEDKSFNVISNIIEANDEALSDVESKKKFRLKRLDVEVGISASGSIGILGMGGESAVELIWNRKEKVENKSDQEYVISASPNALDVYSQLKSVVENNIKIKKSKKKFILKALMKDALRISVLTRSLITMPPVGDWYVSGFFKNYYFSASGDIVFGSIGYARRLRFRFRINSTPYERQNVEKLNIAQKKLRKMMNGFNLISNSQPADAKFKFERVWSIHSLSKELDLGVVSISKGKAIQIAFEKFDGKDEIPNLTEPLDEILEGTNNAQNLKDISQDVVGMVSNADNTKSSFPLSQVRLKFSYSKDVGIFLATVGQKNTVELHFNRSEL